MYELTCFYLEAGCLKKSPLLCRNTQKQEIQRQQWCGSWRMIKCHCEWWDLMWHFICLGVFFFIAHCYRSNTCFLKKFIPWTPKPNSITLGRGGLSLRRKIEAGPRTDLRCQSRKRMLRSLKFSWWNQCPSKMRNLVHAFSSLCNIMAGRCLFAVQKESSQKICQHLDHELPILQNSTLLQRPKHTKILLSGARCLCWEWLFSPLMHRRTCANEETRSGCHRAMTWKFKCY